MRSNGSKVIASNDDKYIIKTQQLSVNTYKSTLIIKEFGEEDWDIYYCQAKNSAGIKTSPPMMANYYKGAYSTFDKPRI